VTAPLLTQKPYGLLTSGPSVVLVAMLEANDLLAILEQAAFILGASGRRERGRDAIATRGKWYTVYLSYPTDLSQSVYSEGAGGRG
jgi:hypothetical protein